MENPIKMDDLGVQFFWKHPNIKWINDNSKTAGYSILPIQGAKLYPFPAGWVKKSGVDTNDTTRIPMLKRSV